MKIDLLSYIWAQNLEQCVLTEMSLVPQMLAPLIERPIMCFRLRGRCPSHTAAAFFAGQEMLPGATLADVLFEEFGIDLPDDTIVYVESGDFCTDIVPSTKTIGKIIGNIVVSLATPVDETSMAKEIKGNALSGPLHPDEFKRNSHAELTQ